MAKYDISNHLPCIFHIFLESQCIYYFEKSFSFQFSKESIQLTCNADIILFSAKNLFRYKILFFSYLDTQTRNHFHNFLANSAHHSLVRNFFSSLSISLIIFVSEPKSIMTSCSHEVAEAKPSNIGTQIFKVAIKLNVANLVFKPVAGLQFPWFNYYL